MDLTDCVVGILPVMGGRGKGQWNCRRMAINTQVPTYGGGSRLHRDMVKPCGER